MNIREFFIGIFLVLSAIKLIKFLWGRRHLYILSYKCNGKFAWPLIGNLLEYGFSGEVLYKNLHKLVENYPAPVKGWIGPFLSVVITDPDDIQIIAKHKNSMEKTFGYQFANAWLGNSIVTAPVAIWKKHRKIIAQTFNRSILESYVKVFAKQSAILVDQVEKYSKNKEYFDVFNVISRCTLDIILESAFGYNIGSQTGADGSYGDKYIKCTNQAFEIFYKRTFRVWYYSDKIFKFSSLHKEFLKCVKVFNQITDNIINKKRPYYESLCKNELDSERENSKKTFIDEIFHQLYSANSKWSDNEIRDEINSMIAAGADTTSHSLSFTILMLAMFPNVQEKVYQEIKMIDKLVEYDEDKIDVSILDKMNYLNQVINESLRLFPSAVITGRYTTGDVKIKTKSLVIPKDVLLTIGTSMLHRDKKIWGPNADQFDPENFSKENINKRHPYAFIPFSTGPRNCVGLKFAELSMKMILYKLLKFYKLETEERFDEIRCEFHLLIKKVGGWKVKIRSREPDL